MGRSWRTPALAGFLIALSASAAGGQQAQSTREVPAGGLIFASDPAIAIEAKELVISTGEIRAAYRLRNTGKTPRAIVIAFPFPALDMAAFADHPITVPAPQSANFVAATFTADGAPVAVEIEQRAQALELDVTRSLEEARVPLLPFAKGLGERLGRLPSAVALDFLQRGIARADVGKIVPSWTLRTTAHWRQAFGAGQSIALELAYRPIVAAASFSPELLEALRAGYCINSTTDAAITRKVAASGGKVSFQWLSYALTSGSHLFSSIERFQLRIAMPELDTIVATCRSGLRRPGPTMLEWAADDFHPDDDLNILFVQ